MILFFRFAFKTKGNLTKHMKSKAHYKRCTELGIHPVPTTVQDPSTDTQAMHRVRKGFTFMLIYINLYRGIVTTLRRHVR